MATNNSLDAPLVVGPVRARAVMSGGGRGAPTCVPRICEITFSRIEQLLPFEADVRQEPAKAPPVLSITVALEVTKGKRGSRM